MYTNSILAVSGLLSLVAAVPMAHEHHHQHHQRDHVWVTETEVAVVTVPVTQTVWLEAGETAPVQQNHENRPVFTSRIQQTLTMTHPGPDAYSSSQASQSPYVPPTSSSTSQYVAPTTSSTSEHVAPPPAPTTSSTSVYVPPPAPTTSSTSQYVPPAAPATSEAPTSTWAPPAYSAPAPSSSTAAPAQSSSTTSGGSGLSYGMGKSGTSYSGDITYYDVSVGITACGGSNKNSDYIVAMDKSIFQSYGMNSNANPLCHKTITIVGENGPVKAEITDMCPGCAQGDLDLTESLFQAVAPHGDGRVKNIKWSFD